MASKWIIVKGEFRIGNVTLHEGLLGMDYQKKERRDEVVGGGLFSYEKIKGNKKFKLYGASFDFGSCEVKNFDRIKWPKRFENDTFYFHDEFGKITKVK